MTIKRAIFFWLIVLIMLALPVQCVIDHSSVNVAVACIAMASSIGVLLYVGFSDGLRVQPLSTMAILGFCVTTHMGALIVQSAAWTPLRSFLYTPLYTYGAIVFYQWIAIGTHAAYRYFAPDKPRSDGVLRGVLGWLGLYKTPSAEAIWFMGCFGLVCFYPARYPGIVGKVGSAFTFLTWAPFLIPFYLREIGDTYCNPRLAKILLVAYTGAIVVLGLALNARQIMFIGVLTVGLLYLFAGMRSKEKLTGKMVQKVILGAVLLAVLSVPLSNLATAMAIARGWRGKISPVAMIKQTYHIMKRPELIAAYRLETAAVSRYQAYDERYIANPGLARLINTKFIDNSLHFAGLINGADAKEQLRRASANFYLAVLPAPILDYLDIKLDKDELNYSMGDYLAYLSRGIPLGGHKTGSFFAQGQALFGPFFPFLYAVMCVFLFGIMDLLTIHRARNLASISALGMLTIWFYFNQGIHFEALHSVFFFFVRNFEQMVLIYVAVFVGARMVERMTHALFAVRKSPPAAKSGTPQWPQPT